MDNPIKVLGALWVAITIPVIGVGFYLAQQVSQVKPAVEVRTVVVTPTASPEASIKPTIIVTPTKAVIKTLPTVKGGASK